MNEQRNVRIIYQLTTKGDSLNGWPFRMRSKALFVTKEAAEAYIPEFEAACYDRTHFECAQSGTLRTTLLELDLYD